jgi:hypothetical protein
MLLEKLITLKKLCMEPTTNEGNPITLMHFLQQTAYKVWSIMINSMVGK